MTGVQTCALPILQRALSDIELLGVTHNLAFLRRVAGSPRFQAAQLDTHLLTHDEAHWAQGDALPQAWGAAAAALADGQAMVTLEPTPARHATDWANPWLAADAWRAHTPTRRQLRWQALDECGQPSGPLQHWVCERQGSTWRVTDAASAPLAEGAATPCADHTRPADGEAHVGRHTWAWQATGAPLAHLRVLTQPHARGTRLTLFTDQGQAHGDRKSTRLNSSHVALSRLPSSA